MIETILDLFTSVNFIIIILAYLLLSFLYIQYSNNDKKIKINILEDILKSLENNTINNYDDIMTIIASNKRYKGISKDYSLIILYDLKRKLMLENEQRDKLTIIDKLINEQREQEPFSALEEAEQILFNDILSYKKEIKEEKLFESKLHQLSNNIENKYNENKEIIKKEKRKFIFSTILAILGLIMTLYFGTLDSINK